MLASLPKSQSKKCIGWWICIRKYIRYNAIHAIRYCMICCFFWDVFDTILNQQIAWFVSNFDHFFKGVLFVQLQLEKVLRVWCFCMFTINRNDLGSFVGKPNLDFHAVESHLPHHVWPLEHQLEPRQKSRFVAVGHPDAPVDDINMVPYTLQLWFVRCWKRKCEVSIEGFSERQHLGSWSICDLKCLF